MAGGHCPPWRERHRRALSPRQAVPMAGVSKAGLGLMAGGAAPQKLLISSETPISSDSTSKARFTSRLPLTIARWAPR